MTRSPARAAMIDAAERIVAEEGLAGLSLRKVQIAAGQSNKSAVAYHFGGRDALIDAVLADRAGSVDARRGELLRDLDARTNAPTTGELLEALIAPLIDRTLRHPRSYYGRFLAQAMQDPVLTDAVQAHASTATYRETLIRIGRAAGSTRATPVATTVTLLILSSLGYWEARSADPNEIEQLLIRSCEAIIHRNERTTHEC